MADETSYAKALTKLRDGLAGAEDAYDFANESADKTRAKRVVRAIQGEIDALIRDELTESSKRYAAITDEIKAAKADLQRLKDDVDKFVSSITHLNQIVQGLNGVLKLLGSII